MMTQVGVRPEELSSGLRGKLDTHPWTAPRPGPGLSPVCPSVRAGARLQ